MNEMTELTDEELATIISKANASGSVLAFLDEYFKARKARIWRILCNCEPNLEKLLEAKAAAKEISLIEQELLIKKAEGQSAADEMKLRTKK